MLRGGRVTLLAEVRRKPRLVQDDCLEAEVVGNGVLAQACFRS